MSQWREAGRDGAADEQRAAAEALAKAALLAEQADAGGRRPGPKAAALLTAVALCWSLFQLWFASPLPFALGFGVFNDTEARSLHLALAVLLAFLAWPALRSSPQARIPAQDWLLAAVGAFCMAWLFIFYRELSARPGQPISADLLVAGAGLLLLLEAARRTLGLPLVLLAGLFVAYIFFGYLMPDILAHKGASLGKGLSHLWLGTEGVFGVALGVSTGFIFLFVLFGALLETGGAGEYFIRSAIALLGHLRGGPAKAAVLASAATGMISGSSIANVVTTGAFTIPLMKRVGYRPDKAAAVEVAASVDGQIMPPVMGAAAFLMTEYVGIPYTEVLKHALLPALISYLALFYIVHLEALKADIRGIPRPGLSPLRSRLLSLGFTVSGLILLAGAVWYGLGWIKDIAGAAASWLLAVATLAAYVFSLRLAARQPRLADDGSSSATATVKTGMHHLLPVVVLLWNLLVEKLSPALSAFWAVCFMMLILVTQRPLLAWLRGEREIGVAMRQGWRDLFNGLVAGARNMAPIAIATATAGIIVGAVTLTGVGLVMTELVETISGGDLIVMLLLVALICLILGMGLPTTANYIVVSTLMAPVVVDIAAQNDLLTPLIAVHLFVFYFGLMADVTPPVGLASYAAAGIARCDPIRTGVTAFGYSIRTAILPFMFIFNSQLLLIDVGSWLQLGLVVAAAIIANLLFAAAAQGWFIVKSRWWESLALLLVCFTLFRPGYWMDMIYPPWLQQPGAQALTLAQQAGADERLRLRVSGLGIEGDEVDKGVLLPLGAVGGDGRGRLAAAGVSVIPVGEELQIINVAFGGGAAKLGLEPGFRIYAVEVSSGRPDKKWMFIPALLLLLAVVLLQRRRARNGVGAAA